MSRYVRALGWTLLAAVGALGLIARGPNSAVPRQVFAEAPQHASPMASFVTSAPRPATIPAGHPQHVVIISEDGMRPDALTAELAPRHVELMARATVARAAFTIPQSDTLPSHASMLSGYSARRHGLSWNRFRPERGYIDVPTVFSIAKRAGLSTAMIVGKPKLRHLAPTADVDHFERPSYLCGGVSRRAAAYFRAEAPQLLFVHFSDPDEYGHSHGWMSPEYRRAVRNSDRCLGTMLDAIDAAGVADSTLVIVTADHGGHGHQHSHRHHVTMERQIPWIARGPGAHSQILEGPITTMDTAATVLAALRLAPGADIEGVSRLRFPEP